MKFSKLVVVLSIAFTPLLVEAKQADSGGTLELPEIKECLSINNEVFCEDDADDLTVLFPDVFGGNQAIGWSMAPSSIANQIATAATAVIMGAGLGWRGAIAGISAARSILFGTLSWAWHAAAISSRALGWEIGRTIAVAEGYPDPGAFYNWENQRYLLPGSIRWVIDQLTSIFISARGH